MISYIRLPMISNHLWFLQFHQIPLFHNQNILSYIDRHQNDSKAQAFSDKHNQISLMNNLLLLLMHLQISFGMMFQTETM